MVRLTLHGNIISVNTFSSVCNQSTVELFDIVLTTMYATLEDLEIYRYALESNCRYFYFKYHIIESRGVNEIFVVLT